MRWETKKLEESKKLFGQTPAKAAAPAPVQPAPVKEPKPEKPGELKPETPPAS